MTAPIELLTGVSLLNQSCWDSEPISRASLQASDSAARYPAVPLLRWLSDDGRGLKTEGQKCHRFDFSRHRGLFASHKERRLLLVESKQCFGELMWLHALQSDNKKILILSLDRFNLYFGKLETILRFV